jgi:SHOCT-like domain
MPDEALDQVLRLVAEGRLSAEEAGPILDALDRSGFAADGGAEPPGIPDDPAADPTDRGPARAIRIQVRDAGRTVVNLRIPLSLGRVALTQVPGISEATSDRIREAIKAGIRGPIVEVDDGADGVRISIE